MLHSTFDVVVFGVYFSRGIPGKAGGLQQREVAAKGNRIILIVASISRRDAPPVLTNCHGDQPATLGAGEGKV